MNLHDLRIEGYWYEKPYSKFFSKESPYPMPIPNVLTEDEAKEIYGLIVEKEKEATVVAYRGFSYSRITGETLGNKEYETNTWCWPSDFSKHYVLDHKVKPTDDFLHYIGYFK